jgi:hypothetical protein
MLIDIMQTKVNANGLRKTIRQSDEEGALKIASNYTE